ncbi:DUF1844 domain-containing protein [Dissulfurirhabdus thermomarina]|uniref:DUF1844 domain-containing protein n=1 Tax=Dissulfurirhabdus thermomarina TaxID=1765737 RepID=A0A6N9TM02_DISTH|nr:DUF1844 domain-containing protein [Dissulfurirhabdus thermomarina]NDY42068.1 DUF1844 domain-containing protein [Dissulfurirhabdus thermomarina]NMX24542.1 DUF1844 domain-containing protein [Dissulfurirhabdus thermomarina]
MATRDTDRPTNDTGERDNTCRQTPPLPDVTFSTFVLSLNTSALCHLGEMDDPVSGKRCVDLVLAKQAIDTLALLQEKTAGNLTEEEAALLEHILFDLRLRFVKAKA